MSSAAPLSFDVVVAGGGIVGAACALASAQAGLRVALVEREFPGSGATAAGMGHIVVMDDSEAQFALTRRSQQTVERARSRFAARRRVRSCWNRLGGGRR